MPLVAYAEDLPIVRRYWRTAFNKQAAREASLTVPNLHAVVSADRAKGLTPGVIFVLRNVDADENINRGNRLHPHYLVYLDNNGTVIADHTERAMDEGRDVRH